VAALRHKRSFPKNAEYIAIQIIHESILGTQWIPSLLGTSIGRPTALALF
jgi:hypothetical protein